MANAPNLVKPTADHVRQFMAKYDGHPEYYGADAALTKLFGQWPHNTDRDEVLLKVVALNRLYSTNVWAVWTMAEHIADLNIDPRLAAGDLTLVHAISTPGDGKRCFHSFATKYCAWHRPETYPIYDSYVEAMLWAYRKQFEFAKFYRYQLGPYAEFARIHREFRKHFGLLEFTPKEIDKFLWIQGKQAFGA